MQYRSHSMALFGLGFAALAISAGLHPAHGQGVSPWVGDAHSQVRLIAGINAARQPTLRAGIDIKLAPGWKTYWRYPGDAGVPPQFDFGASRNVKAVNVLWPAPARMADGGGQSIGYHDRVIMPLRIEPADPAQPVLLHLKLSYAVCEKLCVPAEATARLSLGSATGAQNAALDTALAAAEARVPKAVKIGNAGPLAIQAVRREDGGDRPRIVVDVAAPKDVPVDLFAEGPTSAWALPLPEAEGSPAPGLRRFSFELDGLPAGTQPEGAELTFTLVAGDQAIEVKSRLD